MKTLEKTPIWVDIDTQVDFMLPHGALYVPQAEEIIPNLRRLMECARREGILVVSSADVHPPDDPSFEQWPPHCVAGTEGQERIPETQLEPSRVLPNHPGLHSPLPTPLPVQIILEKQDYDISSNPNFDPLLERLGERDFFLFGVATEYCVVAAGLALRRRGKKVRLITDAIRAITEEGGRKAIEQMRDAGVVLQSTEEVLAGRRAAGG